MATVFDRPTPFTLKAFNVYRSDRRTLTASVRLKDSPKLGEKHFLIPQILGGSRDLKRSERWLRGSGILPPGKFIRPGPGARLNSYGNISGPQMVQILSVLKAFPETGYQMNITERSKKRNKKPRNFFVLRKSGSPTGVFERRGGALRPVLTFIGRPQYRRRFNFYNVAEATVHQHLNSYIRQALEYAAGKVK
jgi:hypothetical protein